MFKDHRTNRQIFQDINREQRFQTALGFDQVLLQAAIAQGTARQIEQLDELNAATAETNERLGRLGASARLANRLLAEQAAGQARANRTLDELKRSADETNALLYARMGQAERHHNEDTWQRFAMWRSSTEDGKAYLEWQDGAKAVVDRCLDYTARMDAARMADIRLNAASLIADDPEGLMGEPVIPAAPPRPAKPKPHRTVTVGPAPQAPDDPHAWLAILPPIPVLAVGAVLSFTLNPDGGLPVAWLLATLLAAGVVYLFSRAFLAGRYERRDDVKRYREADRARRERIDAAERAAADHRFAMERWRAADDAWAREYGTGAREARIRADWEARREAFIRGRLERARRAMPPATHWAAVNPMDTVRAIRNFMDAAVTGMPVRRELPDLRLPLLATVGSLPEYAPNMRAALAAILLECVDDPMADVAPARPGEDANAPFRPLGAPRPQLPPADGADPWSDPSGYRPDQPWD